MLARGTTYTREGSQPLGHLWNCPYNHPPAYLCSRTSMHSQIWAGFQTLVRLPDTQTNTWSTSSKEKQPLLPISAHHHFHSALLISKESMKLPFPSRLIFKAFLPLSRLQWQFYLKDLTCSMGFQLQPPLPKQEGISLLWLIAIDLTTQLFVCHLVLALSCYDCGYFLPVTRVSPQESPSQAPSQAKEKGLLWKNQSLCGQQQNQHHQREPHLETLCKTAGTEM